MKNYSESDLRGIFGMVNDPRFNAVRIRITTDEPLPLTTAFTETQKRGDPDAELGGDSQRGSRKRAHD